MDMKVSKSLLITVFLTQSYAWLQMIWIFFLTCADHNMISLFEKSSVNMQNVLLKNGGNTSTEHQGK